MCRRQHNRRCASCFKGFLPASHAQTPAVTAFKTGKGELRNGRAEIVPDRSAEPKELLGHNCANRVQSMIAWTSATIAIAIEAGARLATAAFKFATKDIRKIGHCTIYTPF